MATYNGAKYLQEQLDSFAKQSRLPDELVVCDDASTDETLQLLEKFCKSAPFEVKIYVNEVNLGYAQNFSRALSLCEGDLVFLSDQDDVWLPQKIETIERAAQQDQIAQVFMNDAELVHGDLTPTGLTNLGQIRSAGEADKSFLIGACLAVRRNFLFHLLPIPSDIAGHDRWLVGFAEGLGCRSIVEKPLQLYRRHGSNQSQNSSTRLKKTTKLDKFFCQLQGARKTNAYEGLYRSLAYAEGFIERARKLSKTPQKEEYFKNIDDFIARNEKTKKNILIRIRIVNSNRLLRIYLATKFFCSGGYNEFHGYRSYLRDLIL